jgi:hypothetical protein
MICTHTSTLGVYLLGALEPEERSGFEAHLAGCDTCRTELVRLSPLPGLLNQITLADFEDPAEASAAALAAPVQVAELPPPVALDDAVEVVEAPPLAEPDEQPAAEPVHVLRGRYWVAAAAAAVVVALTIAGIFGYEAMRHKTPPQAEGITWSATNTTTGVHADARMIERPWGTEIQIKLANVPPGEACRLVVWAKGPSGYRETASWWGTEDGHPSGEIPGATSIAFDMITKLEVVSEDDTLLVDLHRPSL